MSCAVPYPTAAGRAAQARLSAAAHLAGYICRRRRSIPLVFTLLRRPLGDRDWEIADRGLSIAQRDEDVLEPIRVVALGMIGARLRAAALFAIDRADDRRLGAIEHIADFERERERLIVDASFVEHGDGLVAFLEIAHFRKRVLQAGFVTKDADFFV